MGEPLGHSTVVREKDEAFGLRVEPPHIEEPGQFLGQKIENGVARVNIFSRRNETRRFVQHDGVAGCALKFVQTWPLILTRPAAINSSQ